MAAATDVGDVIDSWEDLYVDDDDVDETNVPHSIEFPIKEVEIIPKELSKSAVQFELNVNAKIFVPLKNVITEKSKSDMEIQNENRCPHMVADVAKEMIVPCSIQENSVKEFENPLKKFESVGMHTLVASSEEQSFAESDLVKELTDLIECVICLDIPTQSIRIYQCENGHLFCGKCLEKKKNCSVCEKSLTNNSRNLMIEKVLSILNSYCSKKDKSNPECNTTLKYVNNDYAKVLLDQPAKKIITDEKKSKKPEKNSNEDWCQVVKKNVKVSHHHNKDPTNIVKNGNDFNFSNYAQNTSWKINEHPDETTVRIRISNKFAGIILGDHNGSSIINDIRSSSKARITCNDSVKDSNERILNICGNKKQIKRAQFLLLRAEEGIITGKETNKMIISQNMAGYLLGNRCAVLKDMESDSKASIFLMDSDEVEPEERIVVISGTPEQIQRAKFLMQNPTLVNNEGRQTIQLTIPCGKAGEIIGNGGDRIRGLELKSKARIHIEDPSQGTNRRILTISGNKEQVQKAKSLLPPCVTVGNPQDLRPKVEEADNPTGHLPKKKNLPVLKWKTNARFKRTMNR